MDHEQSKLILLYKQTKNIKVYSYTTVPN